MKRFLKVGNSFLIIELESEIAEAIQIDHDCVPTLVIELVMVLWGESPSLTLLFSNKLKAMISLSKNDYSSWVEKSDTKIFSMSKNDLECFVSFLLIWYRDEIPSVNHLDIDLGPSPGRTLVIKAIEKSSQ